MCLAPNSDNFEDISDLLEGVFCFVLFRVFFLFFFIPFHKKAVLFLGLGPNC